MTITPIVLNFLIWFADLIMGVKKDTKGKKEVKKGSKKWLKSDSNVDIGKVRYYLHLLTR